MPARSPEEIHQVLAAAFNAGDLDAFMEVHEEGATALLPPEGRPVSGREAIRAAMTGIFAQRPRAEIEVLAKLQAGDLALTHASVHVVAGELEVTGLGTIVSRRQPDGSWQIVLDNPMTSAGPPRSTLTRIPRGRVDLPARRRAR
jgi:uncharacterized protein (TIGR02246 family)